MKRKKSDTSGGSGSHPAVVAMREKFESVSDHTGALATDLDEELAKYLADVGEAPPVEKRPRRK